MIYVMHKGKLTPKRLVPGAADMLRRRDAANMRSLAAGCLPQHALEREQAAAEMGCSGVRFCRKTGDAIFSNRQAKLKYLKKIGLHDRDEIRG